MESLWEIGYIVSLFLHPDDKNNPMIEVDSMELIENKGILNNNRYYDAKTRRGTNNKRHVSIIENEIINIHEENLNCDRITPISVRSNIVTKNINLINLIGKSIMIGENAVLKVNCKRDPCYKMNRICPGLSK